METSDKEKVKPVRPNIRELMRAKMREQQSTDGNANAANGDEEVVIMCKPRTTNSNQADSHNEPASDIPLKLQRTHYEVEASGQGSESTPVEAAISEANLNVNFNSEASGLPVSKYDLNEPKFAASFGCPKQPDDDQVDGAVSVSDFEFAEAAMYTATNTSGVSFPRRPQTLTAPGSVSVRAQIDKFSPTTTTLSQVSPSAATNQGVLTTGAPPSPTNPSRISSYAAPSAANLTPSPSASSNGTPNANLNGDPQQTTANMQNGDYEELLQRARAQAERELATEFAATRREQEATLVRLESENRSLQSQAEQIQHANEELRFVIAAYDEQIAKLEKTRKANVEESKRRLQSVEAQRDQAISEVLSLEKAFSDLHRRLEVSKHCLTQQVERERQQAQQLEEALQRVKRWETKYAQLKQHAEEKLSLANREIEKVRKHSSAELAGLEALVKKLELERTSTSEALARKTAEVDELHKICDELLMKLNQRDIP